MIIKVECCGRMLTEEELQGLMNSFEYYHPDSLSPHNDVGISDYPGHVNMYPGGVPEVGRVVHPLMVSFNEHLADIQPGIDAGNTNDHSRQSTDLSDLESNVL